MSEISTSGRKALDRVNSSSRGRHRRNVCASLRERGAEQFQSVLIVVHDQNVQAQTISAATANARCSFLRIDLPWMQSSRSQTNLSRTDERQPHGKRCPFTAAVAPGRDRAAVNFNQMSGDGQSQSQVRRAAGSTCCLPGEIDQTRTAKFRSNALSCISYRQSPLPNSLDEVGRSLCPPAGVNLTAFESRFQKTCCRRFVSPGTAAGS